MGVTTVIVAWSAEAYSPGEPKAVEWGGSVTFVPNGPNLV